jgi:hypothetical protein
MWTYIYYKENEITKNVKKREKERKKSKLGKPGNMPENWRRKPFGETSYKKKTRKGKRAYGRCDVLLLDNIARGTTT